LTDTDGVGVWPNVSSWIRDESRSRVKVKGVGVNTATIFIPRSRFKFIGM